MDRGTRRAIVHGVTRVRPNLATQPPPNFRGRCKRLGGTLGGRGVNVTVVVYLRCFVS